MKTLSSLSLIILFTYTAGDKLMHLRVFREALQRQVLPEEFVPVLSLAIPLAELLAVVLLSVPLMRIYGFALAAFLMFCFTVYVFGAVLQWYPDKPCSCGGVINALGWSGHLVFNLIFSTLALYGLIISSKERRLEKIN